MEINDNDNLTTLKLKLSALQMEFATCAKIGYEYILKGEQLERKIDELQKAITNLKD